MEIRNWTVTTKGAAITVRVMMVTGRHVRERTQLDPSVGDDSNTEACVGLVIR